MVYQGGMETPSTEIVPAGQGDIVVLARNPNEMVQAQANLIAWAQQKLQAAQQDLAEAEENLAQSIKLKIRTRGWRDQVRKAQARVTYTSKILAALEQGYCIVPDFPVDTFAVRTQRHNPPSKSKAGKLWMLPQIEPQLLPVGEGRFVSENPVGEEYPVVRSRQDGTTYTETHSKAIEFDEVDFPFKVVKPQILKDLSRAMQLKIFDDLGVLPARPGVDPMVIGRIWQRKGTQKVSVSFLVTWWVDTRTL